MIVSADLYEADDFIVDTLEKPIQVVYRDDHYVAVFKPAGLVVHRGKLTRADEPVLLQALRDQLNQFIYPIHRLDRPTAGLILFGLHSAAASRMAELFTNRHVSKYYQALVRGFAPLAGVVDKPLQEQYGEEMFPESTIDHPKQTAETHFHRLRLFQAPWPVSEYPASRYSLLEIRPVTGRWHQIRRHLNHIAHPVLGDHRHGDHRCNQLLYAQTGVYRMLLTAMRMDFRHPFTDELLSIVVSRGSEFDRVINALKCYEVAPECAHSSSHPSSSH